MKRILTLMILMSFSIIAFSQSPQRMTYQCVIRNASGELVKNQSVGLRISILQGSLQGTTLFQETYYPIPKTNANGLLSIEIGGGLAAIGNFTAIDWESGPYFLMTETDPEGGSNYTISGTSQLLSVPYALYATRAGNGFSGDYNDLLNKPLLFDHREETDEFNSSSGQTSFTLTRTPRVNSKIRMFINGIRISNSAYTITNNILTYLPANNGSYALTSGDRIQFDYSY